MAIVKKILPILTGIFLVWLGLQYVLPVVFPFLLGLALSLISEPLVRRAEVRCRRTVAAGFGVTVTLVMVAAAVYFAGVLIFGQLKRLSARLPDLQNTAAGAVQLAEDFFVSLSHKAPEQVQPWLQKTVLDFFDGGDYFVRQLGQHAPGLIGSAISRVGDGALVIGTGVLSAFLFSARLPELKQWLLAKLPESYRGRYRPMLTRMGKSLAGWLKVQGKLTLVCWGIVTVGFLLLKIPYAPMWALVVALVDAVPVLGTGTVLLPWALVSFLQKKTLEGVGLLCIYGATFLTRTVLEPRLVGRQLGLDPLITLGAMYLGFRFWGIWGMLLAPILASLGASVIKSSSQS